MPAIDVLLDERFRLSRNLEREKSKSSADSDMLQKHSCDA